MSSLTAYGVKHRGRYLSGNPSNRVWLVNIGYASLYTNSQDANRAAKIADDNTRGEEAYKVVMI